VSVSLSQTQEFPGCSLLSSKLNKTYTDGNSTSCPTPSTRNEFTITSNVTQSGTLAACQPWGLRIHGGVKPYSLTFARPNADTVTNVTMPEDADAYTYINSTNEFILAGELFRLIILPLYLIN
jgi:hypothetical protein